MRKHIFSIAAILGTALFAGISCQVIPLVNNASERLVFVTCQRLIANPIRPVLDVPTTAGLGATTSGQTLINKDFSGNGWE